MSKIAVLYKSDIESIKDALNKLESFGNLVVNGLTAGELSELENKEPALFNAVADYVKGGRWFPLAGMWFADDNDMSALKLMRNIVYSAAFLKEKFGKDYRVFNGAKVYNDEFAQVVYSSGFDAAVLDSEADTYWLDNAAWTRTLVNSSLDKVDVNEIDGDFIGSNEFASVEDEAMSAYQRELDLKSVRQPVYECNATCVEKLLEKAERFATQQGKKVNEDIKSAWVSLFKGDEESAKSVAEKIIADCEFDADFIKINKEDVEILTVKYAEGSDSDVVIRLKETAGKEKSLCIMCDALDAGFRCEILPYELQTFRVIKDGFVEETPITE